MTSSGQIWIQSAHSYLLEFNVREKVKKKREKESQNETSNWNGSNFKRCPWSFSPWKDRENFKKYCGHQKRYRVLSHS